MGSLADLSLVRDRFPGLARTRDGRPVVFADAPGGTQVPRSVIDAIAGYLAGSNANLGGAFDTSIRSDQVLAEARRAGADLLGARPDEIAFGQNMTTLSFALARAVARELGPGDEVVVTVLDHDANVTPWRTAAEGAGATVKVVDVRTEDCTLDLDSLDAALSDRTRVVAFTLASNAVGTVTPAAEIVRRVHQTGAVAVADAVHFAQHRLLDVAALGADVVLCSPYKFFGPHLGVMWARRELLERWRPFKVRPAPDQAPDRWETGTLSHEALAGFTAAVDYLAGLGGDPGDATRRGHVVAGFDAIRRYERDLSDRFLAGQGELPGVALFGIADRARVDERTPTFAVRVDGRTPREVASILGERGIFVWDGNYYALAIMERLGLESSGDGRSDRLLPLQRDCRGRTSPGGAGVDRRDEVKGPGKPGPLSIEPRSAFGVRRSASLLWPQAATARCSSCRNSLPGRQGVPSAGSTNLSSPK